MLNHLYLPETFDPTRFLCNPRLAVYADDARWLVSTVLWKTASGQVDEQNYVHLAYKILRRVMNGTTCTAVIRSLIEAEGLMRSNYRVGVHCYGYQLSHRFLGDDWKQVRLIDPRLIDRIKREEMRIEKQQAKRRRPIHRQLASIQKDLTITEDADPELRRLIPHAQLCQATLINDIRMKRFRFTIGTTGRVFNAITGLKRELRPMLRLANEPLAGVDITASQPSLLAMMLHNAFFPSTRPNNTDSYSMPSCDPLIADSVRSVRCRADSVPGSVPEDVVRFIDEAACGVFYESLADVVERDRDFVKRRFLVDVLAKRYRYPSPVEDAFRDRYPHVFSAVQRVNKGDHCVLIRHLQRLEAWLVIDLVCARLLRDGIPVITIHDSVYAPIRLIERVENAFDAVFDRLGFRFRLKPDCPQTCPP